MRQERLGKILPYIRDSALTDLSAKWKKIKIEKKERENGSDFECDLFPERRFRNEMFLEVSQQVLKWHMQNKFAMIA